MNEIPVNVAVPVDPAEMLRTVWRRKWLLFGPWFAAIVLGVSAAFLLKPIFMSSTLMLLDRGQSMQGPLGSLSGVDVDQQADIMREQVQSTLFLKSVIAATGVKQDPATRAWALKSASRYPNMQPDEQVEAFLVDALRDAINIKRSKGNLFQVTVEDYSAERSRKFCEAVANQFVASSRARQMEAVEAQQEFSIQQLQVYQRELQVAESKLEAARRSAISTTMTGSIVNDRNITFASTLLEQAGTDLEEQRQRLADMRAAAAGKLRDNDAAALSSPDVSALLGQLGSLQNQLGRAQLSEVSVSGGAAIRLSMARKTADLEAALAANAARALPGLGPDARDLAVRFRVAQADVQALEAWHSWLGSQVSEYQRTMVLAPDRELDIAHLQAEVDQKRSLYNAFQQQSAAAQIAEAFQNAKVSGRFIIMEPATLPLSPSKPNRLLLVLLSVIVGSFIGVGTVLVAEQQDQSMRSADEVERLLDLPVLGAIPRVEELERIRRRPRPAQGAGANVPGALPAPRDQGLIQRLKLESPLGLEFKRIYLNLARTSGRTLPETLMVTSSTRAEGKTTTAACLGITLAREHRQRTLLVDFDLRSPALHRALGLPGSSWGLSQMLQQRNFDERFVRQTAMPDLDFLPAGRSERPAAELIDQDSVAWFLREARARYALIVIDAAPNLAVPDPLILGRSVEGVLYVIKAGSTVRKAAEHGVRIQREARDNIIGVLMNDVGEFLPQYYGYKANYYAYKSEAAEG